MRILTVCLASLVTACFAIPSGQSPTGTMIVPVASPQPDYSSYIKQNTIKVTNATSIRLCGVALFDATGAETRIEEQASIAPGADADVALPDGLDYHKDADRPRVERSRYILRAYACKDQQGRRGSLIKEIADIQFWNGDTREFAHPIVH